MKVETQIVKIVDTGMRSYVPFYQCKCGNKYHVGLTDMAHCQLCGRIPQDPIFITVNVKEVD